MISKKLITILVCVMWSVALSPALFSEADPARLVVVSPEADGLWLGMKNITIKFVGVEPPAIQLVSVYLDGKLIKELKNPPFSFPYDFGANPSDRILEVLAVTVSGEKFRQTVNSYHADDSHTVNVMQVVAPVVVTDRRGNYISGLKQEDFIILEDGTPQEISYFNSSGQSSFHLVLLIDISSSMKDKIADVKDIAKIFLRQLMRSEDKAQIVFFNHDVFEDGDFTSSVDDLDKSLSVAFPFGATALYDAIAYSVKLMKSIIGQNIIIILSDGEDNSSAIDPYTLMKQVERSNSVIYSIGRQMEGYNQYQDLLKKISTSSGGMPFFFSEIEDIKTLYQKIRSDIQAKYILQFSPKNSKPLNIYRKITVKLSKEAEERYGENCRIRTMKGYHY